MNESIQELIKKLEGITMSLHRSAGNLDEIVQNMKTALENQKSADFCGHYIEVVAENRATHREYVFKDLDKKETKIWEMMLEEAKKLKTGEL